MAILRFRGIQVTEAGQRLIGDIGVNNARGYDGGFSRSMAVGKLERDGLVCFGYGPEGRHYGRWLTDLGMEVFNHLFGWDDAPVEVGQIVMDALAGSAYKVMAVNAFEVRLTGVRSPHRRTLTKAEMISAWADGRFAPFVEPVIACPVGAGDTIRMCGESSTVVVSDVSGPVVLSDGRTYTVAAMTFLARMGGFTIVPRTVPRLTRFKSTSGTRRRNRG